MEKMLNLVLFGPPGAGKGTQSENLINKYGLIHLSTGDLLRSEIARGTTLGRKAREVMDRGELVSDDIVIGMIESKLDENPKAKGFIFDGFPRTAAQAEALDDLLQKKGTGISAMLALEVEDEELVKRLLLRGKDSGRPDDRDEEVIRRRIEEYNKKTLPLKKFYSEQGKFHSIHGIGSIEEIFRALVDRITFINAEMDLTALESDMEHLDLTISDFEEANDIAPELLLEIDAIKRAEAEEEQEKRQRAKAGKKGSLEGDLLKLAGKVLTSKLKGPVTKDVLIPAMAGAIIKQIGKSRSEKHVKAKPVKRRSAAQPAKDTAKRAARKAGKKKATKKAGAITAGTSKRKPTGKATAGKAKTTKKAVRKVAGRVVKKVVGRIPGKSGLRKRAAVKRK